MKVADLLERFQWKKIPDTQGRFTLPQSQAQLSVEDLIGTDEVEIKQHPSAHPEEVIHIVELEDGGLISYQRQNGTFLHTLNSENMFKRKQWELGIISFSPRQMPPEASDSF
ncbi:hypothetical protein [Gimesia panareensis]|uniref:Uncharacterized protein n=1 Tax=Gimesia panareensis TaxID=2527978 RepID=A0A518AD33_9PLAN|nr:hypothetical protein [Gimesia panareensis]QDT29605.1 hypothetical protein Enr10x_49600 [Gimesia panareensis]QDU52649.1 hypothetical protein Pan110_50290 [Gimesia panareensis]